MTIQPSNNIGGKKPAEIKEFFARRRQQAELIKPYIYLSLYDKILTKIKGEEDKINQYLDADGNRRKESQRYSNVLNPQYFQQKFLPPLMAGSLTVK